MSNYAKWKKLKDWLRDSAEKLELLGDDHCYALENVLHRMA